MHHLFQLFQKHPQTAFKLHNFQGFWVRRNSNSAKQLRQICHINPFISWCKKKFLFFAARWLILSVRQLKPTMRLVFDNRKMWIFICKLSSKVRSKWSLETCVGTHCNAKCNSFYIRAAAINQLVDWWKINRQLFWGSISWSFFKWKVKRTAGLAS